MQTYVYRGDGLGVPGLPHRITQAEADAAGLADLLAAAIAAGVYQPEPPMSADMAPAQEPKE